MCCNNWADAKKNNCRDPREKWDKVRVSKIEKKTLDFQRNFFWAMSWISFKIYIKSIRNLMEITNLWVIVWCKRRTSKYNSLVLISNLILVSYRRFRVVHLLERLIFVVEYASKLNLKQISEITTKQLQTKILK